MFKKCTGAPKQGIKGHLAPLSAFGKHSRNKDGLQPNCKNVNAMKMHIIIQKIIQNEIFHVTQNHMLD